MKFRIKETTTRDGRSTYQIQRKDGWFGKWEDWSTANTRVECLKEIAEYRERQRLDAERMEAIQAFEKAEAERIKRIKREAKVRYYEVE